MNSAIIDKKFFSSILIPSPNPSSGGVLNLTHTLLIYGNYGNFRFRSSFFLINRKFKKNNLVSNRNQNWNILPEFTK